MIKQQVDAGDYIEYRPVRNLIFSSLDKVLTKLAVVFCARWESIAHDLADGMGQSIACWDPLFPLVSGEPRYVQYRVARPYPSSYIYFVSPYQGLAKSRASGLVSRPGVWS